MRDSMKPCSAVLLSFWLSMAGPALAGGLVDPTRPPKAAPATKAVAAGEQPVERPVLRLQGIWHRDGGRVAMVNGVRVRAGDAVDGQRVLLVMHDSVQLRGSDGVASTLHLLPPVRRKASELLPLSDGELAVRH